MKNVAIIKQHLKSNLGFVKTYNIKDELTNMFLKPTFSLCYEQIANFVLLYAGTYIRIFIRNTHNPFMTIGTLPTKRSRIFANLVLLHTATCNIC